WFIGDDFHHNGAFFQMDAFAFYTGFGKPRLKPVSVGPAGYEFKSQDNYRFYLQPLNGLTKLMGDSIAFWKDLMNHSTYDTFWRARNARAHVDVIPAGTATLVVGGLFDAEDCFGAWRTYEAIEKKAKNNNRLVMGPWYHGQWASSNGTSMGNVQFGSNTSTWYQENIEHPFFDHYLKESGDDSKIPEASIFITGANEWKQFETWPPAASKNKELFFQPGNVLSWTKPTSTKSFTEYTSDPAKPVPYTEDVHLDRTREYMTDDQRFASRRPDVIVFETTELGEDLTIAGTVMANIQASISTTDADFVVKVIDVFPEEFKYATKDPYPMGGYQMLVRGEIMRGKFRKSFENPVPFKPGTIETVKFALPDIAHTFKKGHKLMIQVQSSWFPLADRNPQKFMNIYQAGASDFQKSTIRLYHDAGHASSVTLPVLAR
ncbi:MAG TPA: CocE/NonD family hydrolase, partial [Flavitalea sp.]|nr:CocE/NonD family hydrolase [Flavitalea sp.]